MALQSRSVAIRLEIESSLASRIPAALSPQAVQAPRLLPTRDEAVNALLGGGLPVGGICEFTGPASAGRTSLALSVLSEATGDSACAYIDVSDSLDPRSAAAAGVRLTNLLWVRFSDAQEVRASSAQPSQSVMPKRHDLGDRSTQHHGIRHPRTETKGIDRALEKCSFRSQRRGSRRWKEPPAFRIKILASRPLRRSKLPSSISTLAVPMRLTLYGRSTAKLRTMPANAPTYPQSYRAG